jgi:BON domain
MDPNVRTEKKLEVVDTPGQRREVVTERTVLGPDNTVLGPDNKGLSNATIAVIAVVAIALLGVIVLFVTNNDENELANRNANLAAAASPQQPPIIVQQPLPQAPIIIQQPAPAQQAPVIFEQPAPSLRQNTSANDDANMQDIATKRLVDEPTTAGVLITINDARAVLTGTVSSPAAKVKAEQLVKSIRGVKSVDNQIEVAG